jgi:tRNA threonylcarbamoyladenosine biosynthesis protein TsaE
VPPGEVSSPSFAIVATYRGRLPVHHADLYRIADEDELYATGFFDLLGGEGAVLVEWADRIPGALPEERLEIRLRHGEEPDVRQLEIEGTGARHAALARRLLGPRPAGRRRAAGRRPLAPARSPARRGSGRGAPRRPPRTHTRPP